MPGIVLRTLHVYFLALEPEMVWEFCPSAQRRNLIEWCRNLSGLSEVIWLCVAQSRFDGITSSLRPYSDGSEWLTRVHWSQERERHPEWRESWLATAFLPFLPLWSV